MWRCAKITKGFLLASNDEVSRCVLLHGEVNTGVKTINTATPPNNDHPDWNMTDAQAAEEMWQIALDLQPGG